MDAPPIPRLVDPVHAFNGVVVEHFKKRVEKLLSDSIPLWRLLKLLFKILQKLPTSIRRVCGPKLEMATDRQAPSGKTPTENATVSMHKV